MNVLSALLSSVNLRFSVGIAMFLLLCHTVPAADAFSREQVATTYALARPVLRDGASDAALIEHLKSLGGQGQSNIINVLYLVFRESIKEQNEDKKYWLTKLKQYNTISELLSDYLKELNEAMGGRMSGSLGSSAGLPIAQAEAALQKFEAKLAAATLPAADKQSLQAVAAKDGRFFQNARLLEQRVRAIPRTPPASPQDSSPQPSTGPKIPVRPPR